MMLHTEWKKWGEEWIDQLRKFKEVKRKFKTEPSHMCPNENRLGILTLGSDSQVMQPPLYMKPMCPGITTDQ